MLLKQKLKRSRRYNKENFPRILELADGLKKIGEAHQATAGQVALAWLLGQGEDVIPIPGTTKINVRPAWPFRLRYTHSYNLCFSEVGRKSWSC